MLMPNPYALTKFAVVKGFYHFKNELYEEVISDFPDYCSDVHCVRAGLLYE